jgi:hypothetical protein
MNTKKNSSFFFAGAIAAVVFMASFTPIIPNILQPAAAVALPTGEWEIHENGYIGTLRIDSVDAQGVVTGTLEVPPDPSHTITGLYNERTGTLTFYRIINQQDPSSIQTYVGIVFRDGSPFEGTPDRLAGYFIGLPAGGGNRDQNVWGWYATLTSPAGQEAEPSEQAEEETLPNATDTIDTGPSPGIIGPDIGTTPAEELPPAEGVNATLGGMNDTAPTDPDDIGGGFFGQPTPP